jgi:hypothetical protein
VELCLANLIYILSAFVASAALAKGADYRAIGISTMLIGIVTFWRFYR